jgi:nucleotide-binding universal stress UspA family protein
MFKHILIATDGSTLAKKAEQAGIAFAEKTGARLTGYHALQAPHFRHTRFTKVDKEIGKELELRARQVADKYVADLVSAAKAAGVRFQPLIEMAAVPALGIIDAAKKQECDAIFIASHGHRGLRRLMLGSITLDVLAHSSIPVLVIR